jgi:hypothetical protein|tara:strand:+ start:904 stop:1089 length:186 start_codon:yes stop_codon:yes gene_type:complete
MTNTYIKKFSPNASHHEIRDFEIDILGDPEKINEDDDFDVEYYSEDSCKVVKITIIKRRLN